MIRLAIVAGILPCAFASSLMAGPTIYAGKKVAMSQQVSMDEINHSPWTVLLHKYVDTDGQVNYRGLHASTRDRLALDRYLRHLSSASLHSRASKNAKLAFWINAYNAVTIRGILREYPTTSIRNHTAKVFGYNIWKDLQLYVGGTPHSLEHIEHEILRKMGDARIHFAIVCASKGCPRLLNQAFTAKELDNQLEANSQDFFARRQNFHYDAAAKTARLSSIIKWYATDFGSSQSSQLKTLSQWVEDKAAKQALASGPVRVRYLKYDWTLNGK